IHGFVFPVAAPFLYGESFGPRQESPEVTSFHMGVDIAAPEGQQLFAAERCVITQVSSGGLGGNDLWLRGESGTSYYYAHLSRYVDKIELGQVLEAGDVVGYVGSTGHSTGPHLHFEVHPNGGEAINPYPLLVAADPTKPAK
ncbi:MAG: M23 family metallopeptidase, partial [Acidimicrobiales bacterium]